MAASQRMVPLVEDGIVPRSAFEERGKLASGSDDGVESQLVPGVRTHFAGEDLGISHDDGQLVFRVVNRLP